MAIMSQSPRIFFEGHTVTATSNYVYNSLNATADSSGKITTKTDYTVVQIGVPELAASALSYRIEGKFDRLDRWAEIYTGSVTATTTIDTLITVTEKVKELRMGVKVDNNSTPNVLWAGICNTEVR